MECNGTYVKWIKIGFGECVITTNDKWSFAFGFFSNLCWIICFIPQMLHNCRTKSVDGLSPFLFSLLFFGSVISFIGLIIIGGLVTQYIQGALFLILDGILFLQYLIYSLCYPKNTLNYDESEKDDVVIPSSTFQNDIVGGAALLTAIAASKTDYAFPYNKKHITGTIFGWLSTLISLLSRIPQISKNCSEKKVRDLSPMYVILTIAANTFYALSIFIKSVDGSFLWAQLPWIVGCLGPMCFDFIFIIQMCIFGYETSNSNIQLQNEDSDQFLLT